jgi:hypothetical protein
MKKSSAKKTTPAPAPAKKSAPATRKVPVAPAVKTPVAPAVKKTAPKAIVTTISARIDIGFGNSLYLRGEGPGLSWDKGVVMECTGEDQWTLALNESARPIVFKFLRNDEVWSTGEDYTVKSGASAIIAPVF